MNRLLILFASLFFMLSCQPVTHVQPSNRTAFSSQSTEKNQSPDRKSSSADSDDSDDFIDPNDEDTRNDEGDGRETETDSDNETDKESDNDIENEENNESEELEQQLQLEIDEGFNLYEESCNGCHRGADIAGDPRVRDKNEAQLLQKLSGGHRGTNLNEDEIKKLAKAVASLQD